MASHRTGCHRSIRTQRKLARQKMLHPVFVHDQHHQVHRLSADLETETASGHHEKCGSAPAFLRTATCQPAPIFRAYNKPGLQHRGHDSHAFRRTQYFLRNSFIRRALNIIQHVCSGLHALGSLRFFIGRKRE